MDLLQALQYSCNIYFYHVGRERLQPAALWAWAQELGFGRSPGVDLEAPDYDPGRRSLLRREVSREGMCQYAIGGPSCVTASVLQVLRCVAAIALASGEIPWPYLATPRAPERTALRPATARILQEGMRRVVHSPGGTAADDAQGLNLYQTAVKTGTADLREGNPEALDPEGRPVHCAWMAGFAPLERPEIAFAILIERTSLHGGDCAQVAVPLLEYFASRDPGRYRSVRAAEASSGGEAAPGSGGEAAPGVEAGGEDAR